MKNRVLTLSILVPALCMLPSCELGQKATEASSQASTSAATESTAPGSKVISSDVLLTIDGRPKITVAQYEAYVADIVKMQPQFKQILSIMPRAERELCQNYSIEVILEEYIAKNGIDKSATYQEDLKKGTELLKRQLALKYFQEEYPKKANLVVTDAQALAWYNENKDKVQPLILSRGGVNAQGVSFDKAEDAKAFYDKVKVAGANFESIAKDMKLTVKKLKSSEVENAVREKLEAVKTFPSVELVRGAKSWVVQALSKEPTKYRPFDELKEEIKQQLRMQELFTKGIEQIKKELNVVENTKYFDDKEKQCEVDLSQLREQAMKEEEKESSSKGATF
ncbi:MAG: hypothetical protein WCE21_00845 [Candidatus Babeliales bacterium]